MQNKNKFSATDNEPAPDNASLAGEWLAARYHKLNHFINGAWVGPSSAKYIESPGSAHGEVPVRVADGTAKDTDRAVAAARAAQPEWAATGGQERAGFLYAIAREMKKNSGLFAALERLENGEPAGDSRDRDISLAIRVFNHHAARAQLMDCESTAFETVGIVAQIIPRNSPTLVAAWKVAPAMAMGNATVLKPSEFSSCTGVLLAQICKDAGLPGGVFNLLLGDGKVGQHLVNDPDAKRVTNTGSAEVGRIQRKAGEIKKIPVPYGE